MNCPNCLEINLLLVIYVKGEEEKLFLKLPKPTSPRKQKFFNEPLQPKY